MVDDIWKAAKNKLNPAPHGPPYDASMFSTARYKWHNDIIQKQITNMSLNEIFIGHKKDVVLTNKLNPNNPHKRVAIYGWIYLNGKPIQDLNAKDHDDMYEDYSHGVRLIDRNVVANGYDCKIDDVFADADFAGLLSDEGVLEFTSY